MDEMSNKIIESNGKTYRICKDKYGVIIIQDITLSKKADAFNTIGEEIIIYKDTEYVFDVNHQFTFTPDSAEDMMAEIKELL